MKLKTKLVITRDQVRKLLQAHVDATLTTPHDLAEFSISRNGSVEMVVQEKEAPAPAGDQA